jgi:hypothetical protein
MQSIELYYWLVVTCVELRREVVLAAHLLQLLYASCSIPMRVCLG